MRRLAAVFTLSALLAGCGSSEVTFTAESPSANLAAIAISPGELDQIYQPQLERYTSTQGFPVTSVRVTPTGADERAVIRVNGTTVASGTQSAPIPIEVGLNDIAIEVTAADGSRSRAYSIEVTRQFEAQFAEEAYLRLPTPVPVTASAGASRCPAIRSPSGRPTRRAPPPASVASSR